MARISNDTGRALEYSIAKEIGVFLEENKIAFNFTLRAQSDNLRDEHYFDSLQERLRGDFEKTAQLFVDWAKNSGWFNNAKFVEIDRLPDSEGVKGDPTDIRLEIKIKTDTVIKNISIKHHHDALKHPRLPRLPEQCGIDDKAIKAKYLAAHEKIWQDFYKKAKLLDPKATKFSELKNAKADFIDKQLYKPLILLVISFIKMHASSPKNVGAFFKFLTGEPNFYTIKNESNHLLVKHFTGLKIPKRLSFAYPYKSFTTFLMGLDNGWKITFRLHTASEHFLKNNKINTSTKFDVICINLEKVIKIDKIAKPR